MNRPLLYRAAVQGVFGKREAYSRGSITDALFVYLDGEPEPESAVRVDSHFRDRPLVCLTKAWEERIRVQYPDAAVYRRTVMKPACRFIFPEKTELPEEYRLTGMDEAAFDQHPFSHGMNYSCYAAFQAEGSGAVIYHGGEIVAAASSFLSLNGEVEMDISTKETHRGKKLATACAALMLLFGILAAKVISGQNKAIRDRILPVNSLMINYERRETGWTGSGQSTTPLSIWKAI